MPLRDFLEKLLKLIPTWVEKRLELFGCDDAGNSLRTAVTSGEDKEAASFTTTRLEHWFHKTNTPIQVSKSPDGSRPAVVGFRYFAQEYSHPKPNVTTSTAEGPSIQKSGASSSKSLFDPPARRGSVAASPSPRNTKRKSKATPSGTQPASGAVPVAPPSPPQSRASVAPPPSRAQRQIRKRSDAGPFASGTRGRRSCSVGLGMDAGREQVQAQDQAQVAASAAAVSASSSTTAHQKQKRQRLSQDAGSGGDDNSPKKPKKSVS
ncbi:unnamed protein product [Amoebophrya sp. A120]|nr:unnamed protein product [Amoebophrya sp. A120]|eukprot:GSA120T00008121001.1